LYDYKLEKAEEERSKLQPDEFRKKFKINFEDLPISNNTIVGMSHYFLFLFAFNKPISV